VGRSGQLRWTTVGILSGVCAGTAAFLIYVLLPKALVDQGAAVTFSFGLSTLVYFAQRLMRTGPMRVAQCSGC
jgi:hypothetical protein